MPSANLAFSAITSSGQRALIVGIDAYRHVSALAGCVNDARLIERILVDKFGFPSEHVGVLTDDEATRDGIISALDELVAYTQPNDVVVFYYAGHGSQMTDREGDEPSGMDSTLVPVDSGRDLRAFGGACFPNRDITDDELALRLAALAERTPFVTVIVDACHSGTITRDAIGATFGVRSRGVAPDTRPVWELPPSPIPMEWHEELGRVARMRSVRRSTRDLRSETFGGLAPMDGRYVLISGCRDEERAYEYRAQVADAGPAVTHGVLTYFLAQELRSLIPGSTYRDVFERVAAKVTATYREQHPQLEGSIDREFFGVRDLLPMPHVRVLAVNGDQVTLGAGAALGAMVGTRYTVFPPGTKSTDGANAVGEIELVLVGAATSEALSRWGTVVTGSRAIETTPARNTPRLAVELLEVETPDPDMRLRLDSSSLLELSSGNAVANVRLYLLPARTDVTAEQPVPQLGALDHPTWAAVGEDGQLLAPPKPLDARDEVVANIEKVARHRRALELANHDPNSALRERFDLELLQRGIDGTWHVAEPEAGGLAVYEAGNRIGFRVTSRHNAPAYVSLVDLGLTGGISVLFPPPGRPGEAIAPGVAVDILGLRNRHGDLQGWKVRWPNGFPFSDATGSTQVAEGIETVKLFVTTVPADFSFLAQQAIPVNVPRAVPRLQFREIEGVFKRDIVENDDEDISSGEDWTAVDRPFVVRSRREVSLSDGTVAALGSTTLTPSGVTGAAKLGVAAAAIPPAADKSGSASTTHVGPSFASASVLVEQHRNDPLAYALGSAGAVVRQTITIDATPSSTSAARSADVPDMGTVTVQVPDAGPDVGQLWVSRDDAGVVSFHFTIDSTSVRIRDESSQAARNVRRTFRVPVRARQPRGPEQARSSARVLELPSVARVVLQHVVFPLVDPLLGMVGDHYAGRWETKHRPYILRPFNPDNYTTGATSTIDAGGWRRLEGGRALLFLHGTFSRAHTAFGGLPLSTLTALHAHYGGRVFAFDHFTLSEDPAENLRWFIERLPTDAHLDLDIVCHSRGGLVGRLLAERQSALSLGARQVRVGKVVFVGAPNAGTLLADTERMGALIDTYATLLNLIPEPTAKEVLQGVVTVAKQLAVGVVKGLPGLQSMRPGGAFAKTLNAGAREGNARYFALASNYEPHHEGLKVLLANRLMDGVFRGANDLVVPADSVWGANGSGFFPIEQRRVFTGAESVAHTQFFTSVPVHTQLLDWLLVE